MSKLHQWPKEVCHSFNGNFCSTYQGISNNQEEQVSPFLRAYFGPISSIGTRENSPEIMVIEINEDAQSRSMGPVSGIFQ